MNNSLNAFLSNTDWLDSTITWFSADWSPRDYARLTKADNTSAILLKSPPDHSPDAMIGHEIGKWVKMNRHFASLGLNVPKIIAENLNDGFVLMEDFGNQTIADKGMDAYLKATDILITMREHEKALDAELIKYEETHVYKALRFYPQYVLSNISQTDAWFDAWKNVETALPACPRALTHIDYAAQNLMWANDEIGIIDFQAACNGPFVYDIVNLLEDIRRNIPEDVKHACMNRYTERLSLTDKDAFDAWYPIITAQFYARILGQIQFLSREKGRKDLLQYYDTVYKKFTKLIKLPELRPILELHTETP